MRLALARLLLAAVGIRCCTSLAVAEEVGEMRRLPIVPPRPPSSVDEAYPWWFHRQPDGQVIATGGGPTVAPVSYDIPLATPLVPSDSPLYDQPTIDAPRDGFFQKIDFNATWLAGEPISDFGMTDLSLTATFALPLISRERPLVITPGFETHYLEGPSSPDLPPRLYDAWLQFRTLGKIGERWGYDLAVSPGWHSDFDTGSSQALRITGYGFAAYTWSDTLQLLLGVMYLDRENVRMLPAAGLIWTPTVDTRIELVAPRPRVAVRMFADECVEHWWYIAGEYGGGTWAFNSAGTPDVVTYSDYRVMLGWEKKTACRLNTLFEIGYVFGRQIELTSGVPDINPNDTLMFRFGARY